MKTTRAILIDPFAKTVTEVQIHGDTLPGMYAALDCQQVNAISMGKVGGIQHDLWVDEEGLFIPWGEQAFYQLNGYPEPLAGRGLIFACSPDGDTISASSLLTTERVKTVVSWVDAENVEVSAPRMIVRDAEGQEETTLLAGVDKWTYNQQP